MTFAHGPDGGVDADDPSRPHLSPRHPRPFRAIRAPVGRPRRVDGDPRKSDRARERILAAALDCFGERGFEGTRTQIVATRAGVAKALLGYHFHSKENLWVCAVEHALAGYLGEVERIDKAPFPAGHRLRDIITAFAQMSARRPAIFRILTMEGSQNTARLDEIIDRCLRRHYVLVRDLIREGQAEGTVRQCDPARLYYLIISTAGFPANVAKEYQAMTGRNPSAAGEIATNLALLGQLVFV